MRYAYFWIKPEQLKQDETTDELTAKVTTKPSERSPTGIVLNGVAIDNAAVLHKDKDGNLLVHAVIPDDVWPKVEKLAEQKGEKRADMLKALPTLDKTLSFTDAETKTITTAPLVSLHVWL